MQPAWLEDAVFYQIYPQSFQDTNGDGIGDFQGIIQRLDYLQQLGINTLWLNPCFDSPFGDAGYDVRDFYRVAPRYGTEKDIMALFDAAHARGMKVILDLVAGHTSMDNAWFVQEAADPKNPDSNRYIWKNRDFDPAKGLDRADFVANFFWYQPALNYGYAEITELWQDPIDAPGPQKNRAELRKILAYWFDRGCDGFRVDMASSLIKNDTGKRETTKLWQDIREWMDQTYPQCILVAEWSEPSESIPAGYHLDYMMHFHAPGYPSLFFNETGTLPPKEGPCYFSDDAVGSLSIFRPEYEKQLAAVAGKGLISLPTANHDFQRLRCGSRGWAGLPAAWVFLMTQVGSPTIYYGDEIGMRFVSETQGKEGSTFADIAAANAGAINGERAGTRTPMQWDNSPNAGFSTADPEQHYLPLDHDPERPSVASQQQDPESLLNFVTKLLALRRQHPALGSKGSFEFLNENGDDYPMVYRRELDGQSYLITVNPSAIAQSTTVALSLKSADPILVKGAEISPMENGRAALEVAAYGYGIFRLL